MRRLCKFLGYAAAIVGVASIIIVAFALRTNIFSYDRNIYTHKLAIMQVTFDNANPNHLLIGVNYVADPTDNGITLTNAIVKSNSTHQDVAQGEVVPNVLPANRFITVTVSLNSSLPSGTYTITLNTLNGGTFVSPSFNKP